VELLLLVVPLGAIVPLGVFPLAGLLPGVVVVFGG